jgi:hypothetical protein
MEKPVLGTKNPLTYTELHAVILGAVVGVLSGYAHAIGRTPVAVTFTSLFVALTLGVYAREKLSPAQRTVRREPWYALAALLVGGVVGVAVV